MTDKKEINEYMQMINNFNYNFLHHSQTVEKVLHDLSSEINGLSHDEAKRRLQVLGVNEIPEKKGRHPILLFLKQFHNILVYVLLVAVLISFFAGHLIDVYVILTVIIINTTIGFIQEYKAERSIHALKKLIVPYAKVYRDGELHRIHSRELACGDIILLEAGDKIPADARLTEIKNFRTIESSLTGESFPVDKKITIFPANTLLADRKNMAWMGTYVASGQAKAVVTGTGVNTSISKIAQDIERIIRGKGHLEKKVSKLVKQIGIIAIGGAIITFLIGFFIRGLAIFEIFSFALASLVSGIPEGLPAVLVIVLTIGANRMAKRGAIVRRLPAIETVGAATIIATDKTGTLTENTMNVERILLLDEDEILVTGRGWEPIGDFLHKGKVIDPLENPTLSKLLYIAAVCNNARLLKGKEDDDPYKIIGDPTEAALAVLATKAGLSKETLQKNLEKLDSLPFNPELKYRASLLKFSNNKTNEIYVVGAPEVVLTHSSFITQKDKIKELSQQQRLAILEQVKHHGKKAMRVLGLAYKKVPANLNNLSKDLIHDLDFVGVIGIIDPPRLGVKEAIGKAKKAGIRVIMKTGDHKDTAIAIANEIGLIDEKTLNNKYPLALTEQELSQLSQEEFEETVKYVSIFARLSPNMKLRIVETIQKQGHIVAMTGDGVNDAPALKQADIGIAMGIIGTEVAREVSEIVLADDNFATIVDAVVEGRIIFTNIRQTTAHLITTSIAEDITIICSLLLGFPLPLLPIHILWLNLVTDGTGDIALSTEPAHGDILGESPRKLKENILSKEIFIFIAMFAIIMAIGDIFLFSLYYNPANHDATIKLAMSVAFLSMMFSQLFNLWNMRSLKQSIFRIGFFTNKYVNLDFIISIGFVLLLFYFPPAASLFSFVPLGWVEWVLALAASSCVLWFGELYKYLKQKNSNNKRGVRTKV
ncbi:MAG: HAD-IC family P-type ATPase [Candidatus Helarchaeota archaeon]|nr:HAD-IC family P-type ATPase [Candidatus Helarchaeota archaeon]